MREIFEILSVFDWISYLTETAKDIAHDEETYTIWVGKGDLSSAKKALGHSAISTTTAAFNQEAGISVPLENLEACRRLLSKSKIRNW